MNGLSVVVGAWPCGHWFAVSRDVDWLAVEGDSIESVQQKVMDIVPRLAKLQGIAEPIEIEWYEAGLLYLPEEKKC